MKNIDAILKDAGIELTEDQKQQVEAFLQQIGAPFETV